MQNRGIFQLSALAVLCCLALAASPASSWSTSPGIRLSKVQTVYVPAYSNVFSGPRSRPFKLATTLSIRSTDLSASFRVTSIDYYDTNGKLPVVILKNPSQWGPWCPPTSTLRRRM
ncbi:MAG TPA: DUF3124 domain-containing protein [Geobacteraceae bacterium]|nr:DUF3124 domain-containing protein [Geobacteraceae bacterium]